MSGETMGWGTMSGRWCEDERDICSTLRWRAWFLTLTGQQVRVAPDCGAEGLLQWSRSSQLQILLLPVAWGKNLHQGWALCKLLVSTLSWWGCGRGRPLGKGASSANLRESETLARVPRKEMTSLIGHLHLKLLIQYFFFCYTILSTNTTAGLNTRECISTVNSFTKPIKSGDVITPVLPCGSRMKWLAQSHTN